jgi:hypothetical protein
MISIVKITKFIKKLSLECFWKRYRVSEWYIDSIFQNNLIQFVKQVIKAVKRITLTILAKIF